MKISIKGQIKREGTNEVYRKTPSPWKIQVILHEVRFTSGFHDEESGMKF